MIEQLTTERESEDFPSRNAEVKSFEQFRGQRIGIFGGSFDPPQPGHLQVALDALVELSLDAVIFIPAAQNPLKPDGPVASAGDRYDMIRAMIQRYPGLYVSDIEFRESGPSYTVWTLESVTKELGEDTRPFFIIGDDCVPSLHLWKEIDRLVQLADIAVVGRPGYDHEMDSPYVSVHFEGHEVDVSSTQIRDAARKGLDIGAFVTEEVEGIISDRGLYT